MSLFEAELSPFRLIHLLLWLSCCCLQHVAAIGVQFTKPPGGATMPSGPVTVQWVDAGGTPSLANLTTYQLQLMVGGNLGPQDSQVIQTLVTHGDAADGHVTVNISAAAAQSIQNGFYLRMESNTTDDSLVINYSGRFTLIEMTGSTRSVFVQGAADFVGDDNVPAAQLVTGPAVAPAATTVATASVATATNAAPQSTSITSSPSSSEHLFDLDSSTTIAVAIGGILVGFALVAVGWGIWVLQKRRRARRQARAILRAAEEAALADKIELPSSSHSHRDVHEVDGRAEDVEVEGSPVVHELEGDLGLWELSAMRRSRRHSRSDDIKQ